MAFPRNELKFYIHTPFASLLFSRLSVAMEMDTHTKDRTSYRIRSLYLDDPSFLAYRDKIDGLEKRAKYRIRFYNGDLSYLRLEKKEKIGQMCFKTLEQIPLSLAEMLISGEEITSFSARSLISEFERKIHTELFAPRLFVDYERSAFLHPVGNVRITIDSNVCASRFEKSLADDCLPIPVLPEGTSVLEVKYDSVLPPYLSELLSDIPKTSAAISKYCLCAQALY